MARRGYSPIIAHGWPIRTGATPEGFIALDERRTWRGLRLWRPILESYMKAFAFVLPVLMAAAPLGGSTPTPTKRYHCPPCGCASQGKTFDRSGKCPDCGMALIEGEAPALPADTKVAILIFPGVQIIDLSGPYETFGQAGFNVYTVAEKPDTLTTTMGLKITPSYTFTNCPKPDVLVIPGGTLGGTLADQPTLQWIRDRSKDAKKVLSVCNGAFILAKTGLLDGLSATTYAELIGALKKAEPKVKVVSDQRFVDNGEFITTAGLSAGIDGSLHVIELLKGHGAAQEVALRMEYDWRPDAGFVRAALADRQIPHLRLPDAHVLRLLSTEGTRSSWHIAAEVESALDEEPLRAKLVEELKAKGGWTREKALPDGGAWRFTGSDGGAWSGTTTLRPVTGQPHVYRIALDIQRRPD